MRLPHPVVCAAATLVLASCSSVGGMADFMTGQKSFSMGAPTGAESADGSRAGSLRGRLEEASEAADAGEAEVAAAEAARRLATEAELRPPAPVLLARPDGPDQKELPLESLRVATVLSGTRARTLIDCTFTNPHGRTLQGTLMVRLPEGASPARLGMFQGTGVASGVLAGFDTRASSASIARRLLPPRLDSPEALLGAEAALPSAYAGVDWGVLRPSRVVEQEQAKVVYESVTRRRIDPALLEWAGGNSFSARVFPIFPNTRKRVFFVYDQASLALAGRATIPLAVPRNLPPAFRLEVAADGRAWKEAKLVSAGGESALEGGGAGVRASTSASTSSSTSTSASGSAPDGRWLRAEAAPEGAPEGAFILSAAPISDAVQAGFDGAQGIEGPLVHARLRPRVPLRTGERTGSALFLVDTSLSGRTRLAASFGRLLRAILEKDATIERFRLVAFDVAARELTAGPAANGPFERDRALRALEAIPLEGATSIEAALEAAERTLVPGAPLPTVFLLSDAQATWGVDAARDLEKRFPRILAARWICYRLGDAAVNRPLQEALARSGGRIVDVPGAADLDVAATAHRARPQALRSVRVEGGRAQDLVVAGAPRALFPDQTLEVALRLVAGEDPRKATIVLETEAGPQRFPLAGAVAGDAVAARAWAEATAQALLDLETREADRQALALSQRFGIANRVASFLILETDAEYAQWRIAEAALDLAAASRAASEREAARPAGAPDDAALDAGARAFLASLAGARLDAERTAWVGPAQGGHEGRGASGSPPPARPVWGERVDPVAAWRAAEAWRAWAVEAGTSTSTSTGTGTDASRAHALRGEPLRILSSIVEEAPRDAQALRLVGFTLMDWRLYDEAALLFARARRLRSFEPQALLCEAIALEAGGRVEEAALRLEIVLAGSFDARWQGFAKEAARRQYARLLGAVAAPHQEAARARRDTLRLPSDEPRCEVALYWSIDDADVDMHVVQAGLLGREISYRRRKAGGSELLWDNTAGLGPEVYTDRARTPSEVYVHYFGTRATEGTVPAATLVIVRSGAALHARAGVLADARERVVVWSAEGRGERLE